MPTTTKAAAEPADELRSEIAKLRKDFASLVDTVKDLGKEQADKVLDSAKDAAGKASDRAHASAADAKQRGEEFAGELETMVVQHPTRSVLIALMLGYLFGRMRG